MSWRALAPAKINLSLTVAGRDEAGLHPIRSLAMTIDCLDQLQATTADEDQLDVDDAEIPAGRENLVWKAVDAARAAGADPQPLSFELVKNIPAAAGLGGGSADAAAALLIVEAMSSAQIDLAQVGASVGADVPLCLHGGLANVEGHGEHVTSAGRLPDDHVLGIVVPPFEMPTVAVYEQWDRMNGPAGPETPASRLPPSLRPHAPLRNDMYPAAAAIAPGVDDWRTDLTRQWSRPVLMSGSGPSLFAFFIDADEAQDALASIPVGARNAFAGAPYSRGAHLTTR